MDKEEVLEWTQINNSSIQEIFLHKCYQFGFYIKNKKVSFQTAAQTDVLQILHVFLARVLAKALNLLFFSSGR